MKNHYISRLIKPLLAPVVLVGALLGLLLSPIQRAIAADSPVVAPDTGYDGKTYSEWSAAWWQWALGLSGSTAIVSGSTTLLVTHPFIDSPNYDVTQGQTGQVWFLTPAASKAKLVTRLITIPSNTALLIGLYAGEWSDLEGIAQSKQGFNYDDRLDIARKQLTRIDPRRLNCQIDGQDIGSLAAYCFVSPEFTFAAPTPWAFGDSTGHWGGTGATGTSVADGYFILVKPLSTTQAHIIHFTGAVKGASSLVDMIYIVKVQP